MLDKLNFQISSFGDNIVENNAKIDALNSLPPEFQSPQDPFDIELFSAEIIEWESGISKLDIMKTNLDIEVPGFGSMTDIVGGCALGVGLVDKLGLFDEPGKKQLNTLLMAVKHLQNSALALTDLDNLTSMMGSIVSGITAVDVAASIASAAGLKLAETMKLAAWYDDPCSAVALDLMIECNSLDIDYDVLATMKGRTKAEMNAIMGLALDAIPKVAIEIPEFPDLLVDC